ncbi:MAG: DMT family transporter [Betaproteobacteria bacterium]|nr:DMT family transporter [Betaproteobacteria bacterium]
MNTFAASPIPAQHRHGIAVLVLCTFLWSTAGLVTRASSVTNGWEAAFWRSLFLCAVITALMLAQHRGGAARRLVTMGWPGFVSSLAWATMLTCFMLALSLITVANALLMMGVLPFCAAIAGRLFLRESVPTHTWIAIGGAAAGIGVMFHDALRSGNFAGSLIALAVPVAAAVNTVAVKLGRGRVDLVPALLLGGAISVLIAWPMVGPFSAAPQDLALYGALAVFQLALPCILLVRVVLPRLSAVEVGLLSLLEVVLGPLWVWLALGEKPASAVVTGGLVVLAAVAVNEGISLAIERRQAAPGS